MWWLLVSRRLLFVTVILAVVVAGFWPARIADAGGKLLQKRLEISAPYVSESVSHRISFVTATSSAVGSIKLEYCSNSAIYDAFCQQPLGMDVSGVSLDNQVGVTGLSVDPATSANLIILTGSGAVVPSSTVVELDLSNIVSPSSANRTFYVRISTHNSLDGSGVEIDEGGAAFVTAGQLNVSGYVPPYIRLCLGLTVAIRCESENGEIIDFGNLTPQTTAFGSAQFSVATNVTSGYTVSILGPSLTSGNIVLPRLSTFSLSQAGQNQFGLNLAANTLPPVGQNADGFGTGYVTNGYDTPDYYKYSPGETIAKSNLPTDYNRFTTSIVANISEDQPPGYYSTTLEFLALAIF